MPVTTKMRYTELSAKIFQGIQKKKCFCIVD